MTNLLTERCIPFKELTPDELYTILQLRQDVFVLEQHCLYPDMDGFDREAHHFMIYNDAQVMVAYARLFKTNMPYPGYLSIGRVVTHPQYRKQSYGRYLMLRAIEAVRNLHGPYPIKIGAQAYLTSFYVSLGFKDIGQYYFDDGIPHLKMVLE